LQEKLHMTQHPGIDPPSFTTTIKNIVDNNLFLRDTFCFPRGGGQPGDTGIISNSNVRRDLLETLPGEQISHPLSTAEGFSIGDTVDCQIDQIRRNKNTTMHTVQHIVSALANDLFHAETVGNQISEEYTRIDLLFPDRDKFITKFMDRIPASITELRVVEISDIDLCPCGGTHVDNTSKLNHMNITNVKSKGSGKLRLSYNLNNR
jgi:misacylated tRNA(Ala) deacylase